MKNPLLNFIFTDYEETTEANRNEVSEWLRKARVGEFHVAMRAMLKHAYKKGYDAWKDGQ